MRSPVDVELLDVAGNLGVNVDFLEGLKLRGDLESVGEVAPRDLDHGNARSIGRIVRVGFCRSSRSQRETLPER